MAGPRDDPRTTPVAEPTQAPNAPFGEEAEARLVALLHRLAEQDAEMDRLVLLTQQLGERAAEAENRAAELRDVRDALLNLVNAEGSVTVDGREEEEAEEKTEEENENEGDEEIDQEDEENGTEPND
ncbi:hypothetical protein CAEBREN_01549 [Caenorhabditis brenneri]|uniref:Uncharacterized protein n=1 Tax=Caenorhabditis brenneri TaxID=135651 RepID=G0MY88_CAEBE|nr:hypothetical protein CAEBREN_01549 [Caenorhabditis brenneri]